MITIKRFAIYGRFTINSQTTDIQILELKGFIVIEIFVDDSISVAKWREIRTDFENIVKGKINKDLNIILFFFVEYNIL